MGIEYHISCPAENLPKLDIILRRSGGQPSKQFPEQLEFRFRASNAEQMPDATGIVETDYFPKHYCA